jgi:hypothetical protein
MPTRKTRYARRSVPRRRASQRKVTRPWSREEIAFMRKFYRKYETSWIARQLGRTVYSVRYKASDLNIKKANPNVWKGNKGSKNAFNQFAPKSSTRRRPATRTPKTRRSNKSRTWRAKTNNRRTRKSTPRRRPRSRK